MVSRLPVFSGKKAGRRVPPEMVLPIFVAVVLLVALLISYPWHVLTVSSIAYLASLPFGWLSYRRHERAAAASSAPAKPAEAAVAPGPAPVQPPTQPSSQTTDDERPARLN